MRSSELSKDRGAMDLQVDDILCMSDLEPVEQEFVVLALFMIDWLRSVMTAFVTAMKTR